MTNLEYSTDALNVRHAFFGAKTIVYVEGDDDVLFWHEIFSKVADADFEIESVGGSPYLDKYIQQITAGQLHALAARDADFLPHLGLCATNPKVVYTRGYSIENSLYVGESVAYLARLWCKTTRVTQTECERWLTQLAREFAPLVHLDVANATSKSGVPTVGDNCSRFMTSGSSANPCPRKIANHLTQIKSKIPQTALDAALTVVGHKPTEILLFLRGHFLASAIHKFIVSRATALGRKINLSADSLYAAAIAHFGNSLGEKHPHQAHYLKVAEAAWRAI